MAGRPFMLSIGSGLFVTSSTGNALWSRSRAVRLRMKFAGDWLCLSPEINSL